MYELPEKKRRRGRRREGDEENVMDRAQGIIDQTFYYAYLRCSVPYYVFVSQRALNGFFRCRERIKRSAFVRDN
jgi:hypothetical protein